MKKILTAAFIVAISLGCWCQFNTNKEKLPLHVANAVEIVGFEATPVIVYGLNTK